MVADIYRYKTIFPRLRSGIRRNLIRSFQNCQIKIIWKLINEAHKVLFAAAARIVANLGGSGYIVSLGVVYVGPYCTHSAEQGKV